jgi:hypothetical protein
MRTDLFVKALADMNLLPDESARDTGIALSIPSRQLVKIAEAAAHRLSRINEWETPTFCGYASTPSWSVANGGGTVAAGLRWDLLLCDYSTVQHDDSILDNRGFDGDYIMRTIGDLETTYLVRDSDELYIVGWAALPEPPLRQHPYGELGKGAVFRTSAHGPEFNAMQRDLLLLPTYIHGGEVTKERDVVEAKALRTILTWVDPPNDVERYSRKLPPHRRRFAGQQARIDACQLPWWRRNRIVWAATRRFLLPIIAGWAQGYLLPAPTSALVARLRAALYRIRLVLCGDAAAIQWLRWRGRKAISQAFRRPFNEPRPEWPKETLE